MQVKIKESWVFYDRPEDRCLIKFIKDGQEVARIVFNFREGKPDHFGGSLSDHFPITIAEEKQYISERRESAKQRTRSLKI